MPPDTKTPAILQPRRSSRLAVLVIGVLLTGHALLGLQTARQMTVTHDEYWHVPVGLSNWKTGRFDFDVLNPPLIRMWATVPLLFTDCQTGPIDASLDGTGQGDIFLKANGAKYHELISLSRVAIVLLSVLTGVLLARWAWELFGAPAACLTTLLWAASPMVLAHASLVTTDLGAASFFVLTLYVAARHAQQPSWRWTILLGLCLGLAQAAKFTSLLLYPLVAIAWLLIRTRNTTVEPQTRKILVAQWLTVFVGSLLVLNACYLFRGSGARLDSYQFGSSTLKGLSERLDPLGWMPVPFPRDYLLGIDQQQHMMAAQHPVYLNGDWSLEGFPEYYVAALWYKLPHATQLLLLTTVIVVCLQRKRRERWRIQVLLLLPVVCLVVVASSSGMQLGLRYILPAFPFLFLFAGQAAGWLDQRHLMRSTCLVAMFVAVPLSLRHHPHHLAYFNELAGGPSGGQQHLLDSNLDWGQDLRGLAEYLKTEQIDNVGLAYFGTLPPASLGISYRFPPSHAPQPGWYAISVNFLNGRPHVLRDPQGIARAADIGEFAYFRFFEPRERIGYSLYVFHLTDIDVRRWRLAMQRMAR